MSCKKLKRFIALGWLLLEHKARYYGAVDFEPISDSEYDKLEEEYKALALELGKTPTASDMVGFDMGRPSCRLVVKKFKSSM